ncbi:IS5 family transposase [Methylobacterium oryzihabitans]|uniref:IS5 family transposase n=1 Tax=Methylobacterium oryzihabitans TaxID=2499852 RepID=A0A3S2UZL6_9HYPH|nr:IS5 family transposase [Methylobacterium oryzihabitans]
MAELFWLSDEQWQVIAPFMPTNQPGARRKDDRTILSGILHVIKCGCRWKDCPSEYGPHTTVYNRFNRWSRLRFWTGMLEALAKAGWSGEAAALDSTYVKAQRAAHGGKGGPRDQAIGPSRAGPTTKIHVLTDVIGRPGVIHLTPGNASDVKTAPAVLDKAPGRVRRLIADKGYDADWLRQDLRQQGISVVIPGTRARKRKIRLDKRRYRDRWRVEAVFCRLKDFRRIATRYDKLARNFASALALAAVIALWC